MVVARGVPTDVFAQLLHVSNDGYLAKPHCAALPLGIGKPIGVLALFSKQIISHDISILLQGLANTTSQVVQASIKGEELRTERDKLKNAIEKIKVLSGMFPICSSCKKIRDDKGYWNQIETYIRDHSDAEFSHSICPECVKKLYPNLNINDEK